MSNINLICGVTDSNNKPVRLSKKDREQFMKGCQQGKGKVIFIQPAKSKTFKRGNS